MSLNLKREHLGLCRGCRADPENEVFHGAFNEYGTQMRSDKGWWLRIRHSWDYMPDQRIRLPDVVAHLLCPTCLEEHNKRVAQIMEL